MTRYAARNQWRGGRRYAICCYSSRRERRRLLPPASRQAGKGGEPPLQACAYVCPPLEQQKAFTRTIVGIISHFDKIARQKKRH